ncbi:hypothetical protein VTN00DRAFT_775 [Thermoascus crustaceus]|uniref:uncharacterized protein n=1 Tax=Thermoascus crustaceus TaxID=5088 RepID=UPI003744092A
MLTHLPRAPFCGRRGTVTAPASTPTSSPTTRTSRSGSKTTSVSVNGSWTSPSPSWAPLAGSSGDVELLIPYLPIYLPRVPVLVHHLRPRNFRSFSFLTIYFTTASASSCMHLGFDRISQPVRLERLDRWRSRAGPAGL